MPAMLEGRPLVTGRPPPSLDSSLRRVSFQRFLKALNADLRMAGSVGDAGPAGGVGDPAAEGFAAAGWTGPGLVGVVGGVVAAAPAAPVGSADGDRPAGPGPGGGEGDG